MSFNSSIPLVTDPMVKSQKQIRANFQAIAFIFAENHVRLNNQFQGMHDALVFRPQTLDPTTSATQICLYTKLVNQIPQLFYAPSSSQTPIQLTYDNPKTGLQSTNPDVYFDQQYSFIAGPFVIYGGIVKSVSSGTTLILKPTSTIIYAGVTTVYVNNSTDPVYTVTFAGSTLTFATTSGNTLDVYYIAIGKL